MRKTDDEELILLNTGSARFHATRRLMVVPQAPRIELAELEDSPPYGVNPYDGLANESFSQAPPVLKHLESGLRLPSRAQGLSFGSYCAPLCAPHSWSWSLPSTSSASKISRD